jgi:hypothetical protein
MRANRKLRKKSQSQRNRRLFLKEFAIAAQSQMILRLAIAAQTQSVFTKNLHPWYQGCFRAAVECTVKHNNYPRLNSFFKYNGLYYGSADDDFYAPEMEETLQERVTNSTSRSGSDSESKGSTRGSLGRVKPVKDVPGI